MCITDFSWFPADKPFRKYYARSFVLCTNQMIVPKIAEIVHFTNWFRENGSRFHRLLYSRKGKLPSKVIAKCIDLKRNTKKNLSLKAVLIDRQVFKRGILCAANVFKLIMYIDREVVKMNICRP